MYSSIRFECKDDAKSSASVRTPNREGCFLFNRARDLPPNIDYLPSFSRLGDLNLSRNAQCAD